METYESLEIEVIAFSMQDVIVTSPGEHEEDTPTCPLEGLV